MVNVPSSEIIRITRSAAETRELGKAIARRCLGGELILLSGDLGTGKTCFTQGLAIGLDVDSNQQVTSPTFTLHVEYQGRLRLNHLDLYRLDDYFSADTIGLDEMLNDQKAVTVVEWPEILPGQLTRNCLYVLLEHVDNDMRKLTLTAIGQKYQELLK